MATTNNQMNDYDDILRETIKFLRKNWLNPDTGIVACCLIDGNKKAFATSSRNESFWRPWRNQFS